MKKQNTAKSFQKVRKKSSIRKPNLLPGPKDKGGLRQRVISLWNKRSGSIPRISRSNPGQRVSLQNPTKVNSTPSTEEGKQGEDPTFP